MNRLLVIPICCAALVFTPAARGEDSLAAFAAARVAPGPVEIPARLSGSRAPVVDEAGYRAWKRSLIPLAAAHALDMASSYGMRELNPVLAGQDGRFGARSMAIKGGIAAAIVGVEYLLVKKYPRTATVLSKLNWSSSVVTGAFAVHNYAIR
jgi:hypothetical protein